MVIYSMAIGLVTLVLPVATQALVNTVAFGILLQPLVILSLLVLTGLLFSTLLSAFRLYVIELIQRRIFVRTAGTVTDRLLNVRPEVFDRYHGPELVNRFLEVVTVQKAAASLLVDGLSVTFQTIVGMLLLAVYHPWLLGFDVVLLTLIVLVVFPLGSGAVSAAIKESKAKYSLLAWMQEIARHRITFKTQMAAQYALHRTNELVSGYLEYRSGGFRIWLRQVTGSFIVQAIAGAGLLGIGGWLVVQRQLTLGQLVAAELVVALVVSSFTKFGKHLETYYDLIAAIDKLGYLEDLETERTEGEALPRSNCGMAIRFREVSIGHSDGVLAEGINWQIPEGARIGLVGPAGSGKSSIVDVLYALDKPLAGIVEVDGRDQRDVSLADLRSQVKLVRAPEIFEASLADNLTLGNRDFDSGQVWQALERVGLRDAVLQLPGGLRTMLNTGGQPLSPGRSAQLELARALLASPRLLILDEALDPLADLPERDKLLDCLFDPAAPWTLLVVSENREILSRCQSLVALRNGRLLEIDSRPHVTV